MCCLLILILCKAKKWKPGSYIQEEGNTMALNPQLLCQQIDKKKTPFGKMNC